MYNAYGINVEVYSDKNATVAHVISDCGCVAATGSSKRAKGETFVPSIGEDLAVSRALMSYAKTLESRALADSERNV